MAKKEGSFAGWLQRVRRTGEHSDVTVRIRDQEFKLHMLPLVNESSFFRDISVAKKTVVDRHKNIIINNSDSSSASSTSSSSSISSSTSKRPPSSNSRIVVIDELPGGAAAFAVAADFCYIIRPSYTFSNVGSIRASAEFLGMNDLVEGTKKFLYTNVFSSWKSCVAFLREFQRVYPSSDEYIESRTLKIVTTACTKAFLETKHVSVPINLSLAPSTSTSNWQSSPSHNLKDVLIAVSSLPEVYAWQIMQTLVNSDTNLHIKCRQSRSARDWLDYLVNTECKKIKSRCWIVLCLAKMLLRNSPKNRPLLELSSQYWCSLLEHVGVLLSETDDHPMVQEDLRVVKRELQNRIGSSLHELDDYIQAYAFEPETLLELVRNFVAVKGGEEDDEGGEVEAVLLEVDGCLWGFAEIGSVSTEVFVELEEAFPPEFRSCHDMLYAAVERLLEKRKKLSGDEVQRLWRSVDCSKLSTTVYEKAMGNSSYVCQPHVLECVLKRHGDELAGDGADEFDEQKMKSVMQKVIKASLKLLEENSRRSKEIKELQKQYARLVGGSGLKVFPSEEFVDEGSLKFPS